MLGEDFVWMDWERDPRSNLLFIRFDIVRIHEDRLSVFHQSPPFANVVFHLNGHQFEFQIAKKNAAQTWGKSGFARIEDWNDRNSLAFARHSDQVVVLVSVRIGDLPRLYRLRKFDLVALFKTNDRIERIAQSRIIARSNVK